MALFFRWSRGRNGHNAAANSRHSSNQRYDALAIREIAYFQLLYDCCENNQMGSFADIAAFGVRIW
jgi:hypothetical protein